MANTDSPSLRKLHYIDFTDVLRALEQGRLVTRACWADWPGKGDFVFRQVPSTVPPEIIPKMSSLPPDVKLHLIRRGKPIHYNNQFAMVNGNNITGWTPSISDVVGGDWYIYEVAPITDVDITPAPVSETAGKAITSFDALRQKVSRFALLKKGWDSYEANPPSPLAIRNTLTFLDHLETQGTLPDWVEPSSDDSIVLELTIDGAVHEWDFFSDGNIHSMVEPIK